MAGKSLLDDKMSSIGTPKAAAGKKNEGPKLILAVVLFVVAGVVVAWSMGLFASSGSRAEPVTAEQQQAQQAQEQRTQQTIKAKQGVTGGTD